MMINFFAIIPKPRPWRILGLTSLLMLSPMAVSSVNAAPKYKKSTTVDFEGALVEGKSRKPYSAYLTQQKDSAYGEMHRWLPDLDKRLLDSQTRLDKTQ